MKEFCFEKKIIFSVFSTYKKILFFLFLTLCFELCFYTNSFCPLPFLESDVVFFFFIIISLFLVMKEKSFLNSKSLHNDSHTRSHPHTGAGGIIPVLRPYRIISSWKLQLWKESRAWREWTKERRRNNRETNSSTGIPILYNSLKYNAWYIDAWREKPSGNVGTQCHSTWKPTRKLLCKLRYLKSWSQMGLRWSQNS